MGSFSIVVTLLFYHSYRYRRSFMSLVSLLPRQPAQPVGCDRPSVENYDE
jgi:hypothetical protein